MSRLPPAEKLPLALRKNGMSFHPSDPHGAPSSAANQLPVRDEWESKREDLQKELSDVLGAEWTLSEINPNALYPYAGDGYAKQSLGSCIAQ